MSNFDALLTSAPVNRLAALVTSGGSEIELPAFSELSPDDLRRQAREMSRMTGEKLTVAKDIICRTAGYEGFQHYVCVLQSRGEYVNAADTTRRNKSKRTAKKIGKALAGKLGL